MSKNKNPIAPATDDKLQRITQVQQSSFDGPIPPPEILLKYGDVIPDAPERILKVFEDDSQHLRDIQLKALQAQIADTRRIHWMAWSLIAGGYAMSALLAWMNKDWLAGTILTTTIVGTVAGLLQRQRNGGKHSSLNDSSKRNS